MTNKITLSRQDILDISALLEKFPTANLFEVLVDRGSGIGAVLLVTIEDVEVNGTQGRFTVDLTDVSTW